MVMDAAPIRAAAPGDRMLMGWRVLPEEYISLCCNLPAQKPVAGEKVSMKDAESGKMKTLPKGLGKLRCSGCHKISKVSVHKSEPKIVVVDMAKIEQRTVEGLSLGRGSEVPIA